MAGGGHEACGGHEAVLGEDGVDVWVGEVGRMEHNGMRQKSQFSLLSSAT